MGFNIFAMPASSIILLFSVAFGVSNALPWAEPQKTNAYRPDAWSPKPTGRPADHAELFKRTSVDVDVCGWIGGNSAQPAVCSSGSSCIHDTIHGFVGCCTTSGACTAGVYTSCVDSNMEGWSPNTGLADNGIYTCTGTSVCYRNTYPGGYYQYGCGAESQATSVATTYAGQPSDIYLQIVYTGVNFTPTSAPTTSTTSSSSSSTKTSSYSTLSTSSSKSSSATSSKASSAIGEASPSSTAQSAGPTTSATASASKTNVAAIAGGSVGGIAGLAALIALGLFLFQRHQKKHYHAGPFISSHLSQDHPPTSGPFQRLAPFSPDDFTTPPQSRGITTTSITAGPITFPPTYAYAGASDPQQPYSNGPPTPYFPPPARSSQDSQERDRQRDEEPLVSEIDDFSRSFHNAMQQHMREEGRDTHIHSGVLPGGVDGTGIGMGLGAPLLGNHRTEDREARSEAFRSQLAERNAVWTSPLRSNPTCGSTYGSRSVGSDGGDEDVEIPPKSPLRQSMHVAGLSSAVGRRSPDHDVRRYQLVDEVVGDDIPILHSPGQLRHSRHKSRG